MDVHAGLPTDACGGLSKQSESDRHVGDQAIVVEPSDYPRIVMVGMGSVVSSFGHYDMRRNGRVYSAAPHGEGAIRDWPGRGMPGTLASSHDDLVIT